MLVMSKTWKIVLAVTVVLVVAVGGGIWWFLRDDAPAEVNLDDAAASVTTTTAGSSATTASGPESIDGTWTVDDSSGSFDFETATGTFAGFRIKEELSSIGSTTAVGRTGAVTGTATIAGDTLTAATFDVDTRTFTTNATQRDSRVQSALETGRFPTATFTLTQPVSLGSGAATGSDVSVTAVGNFTLHGVTTPVEVPIQARLVDRTIVLVGSFDITFSDYGVSVPKAPIVLSVADTGTVEMQLLLTKQ
jgi:polyisoprenoid-binding protein YceI